MHVRWGRMGTMRFRPRFSIRTLAIVVTLVCAYFGAWEMTKRYGMATVRLVTSNQIINIASPVPLLIRLDQVEPLNWRDQWVLTKRVGSRSYYIWIFGATIKLPFESELPESEWPDLNGALIGG